MENIVGKQGKIIFEDVDNRENKKKATKKPIKKIKEVNSSFISFIDQENEKQVIPSSRIIRLVIKDEDGGKIYEQPQEIPE